MPDTELAELAIEDEIVRGTGAAVVSCSLEPESYGAGFDAGYVAGLHQALKVLLGQPLSSI